MKPLNRPMFRYGGPIKEGVMDGIREPKKNGGLSKQFNTGLVGDERYPKTDGREHHVAFIPPIMAGLGIAGRVLARPFGKFVTRQAQKIFSGPNKRYYEPAGYSKNVSEKVFNPNKLGSYFAKSPEAGLVKGLISGSGKIAGPLKKVAVGGAKSPLTVGGLLYMGGSYFYPDGTPAAEEDIKKAVANAGRVGTSGAPGGGDPGMYLEPQAKGNEGATLSKEELRKKNVERYRDIMDIKGMNKDAAYNSLIAASQAINESGDFKGDIKSGKLINQIIQATSKQFDKPKQTKDAIDTLILKGEIEKDLNKEKNILDNEYKRSAIALNEAKIAQDSLMGDRKSYLEKNKALPSGQMLAGLARNRGYQVAGIEDVTEVKNWMKENGKDEVEYLKDIMTKTEIAPGIYVINTRLIQVTEDNKLQEI